MTRIATAALTGALGLAALAHGSSARAGVYIGIGIPVPGVVVAPPVWVPPRVVYAPPAPYYYSPGYAWPAYRGYARWYGPEGYWRHWDRDDRWHERWEHEGRRW